jgi:hypothetical protein
VGFIDPSLLKLKAVVVIIVIAKLVPQIEVVLMLRIFHRKEGEVHLCTNYRLHLKVLQGYKDFLLLSCLGHIVGHEYATTLGKHIQSCFPGLHSLASLQLQVFQVHPRTQEALQLDSQEVTEI